MEAGVGLTDGEYFMVEMGPTTQVQVPVSEIAPTFVTKKSQLKCEKFREFSFN